MGAIGYMILSFLRAYWQQIAIALLIGGIVGGYSLHERHVQKAKDDKVILALKTELVANRSQLAAYAATIRAVDAAQAAQQAAQAEQARQAAAAVVQAVRGRADADKSLSAWRAKYRVLLESKQLTSADCSVPTDY